MKMDEVMYGKLHKKIAVQQIKLKVTLCLSVRAVIFSSFTSYDSIFVTLSNFHFRRSVLPYHGCKNGR